MYTTCPSCGHSLPDAETRPASACPACGVIFSKWLKRHLRGDEPVEPRPDDTRVESRWRRLAAPLLHVEPRVNQILFAGRCLVLLGLVAWSGWFFQTDHRELLGHLPEINSSFMHAIDLAFHEAGHVLFRPFGDFMTVLGGSLMQLLVPAAVMVAFVYRHANAFGGAVAMWWLGQSAMDLAPYVYDARHGQLLLIGGFIGAERPGAHDWSNILGRLGMLEHAHALGTLVDTLGMTVIVLALAWGAVVLRLQYRNLDRRF